MVGEPDESERERPEAEISEINPAASVIRTAPPAPAPVPPSPAPAAPPIPPVPPAPHAAAPVPPADAIEVLAPSGSQPTLGRLARAPLSEIEEHISEFAADVAGGLSPFGDDLEFPLPIERLGYQHPGPANRPTLAGD